MEVLFAGRFTGIPREAFTFFKGLASHNNREWFHANKDVYEGAVRRPMQSLLAELAPTYGSGKLTRINRDMRFARGQAPYKTFIASIVGRHYISLSKDGLYVGTGLYMPEGQTLQRLRAAIDDDESGRKIAAILATLRRKRYYVGTHETAARAPRGYTDDHPRIDLLRMKDLHAGKQLAPSVLSTRKALARVVAVMNDVDPLSEWLRRHVT
ncbi:MAG: DUF2461 domain-containing protein [Longimicrobiales bacterium]